jgi:Ethanolamine utilization protein EutJ (predicted chaperonin)
LTVTGAHKNNLEDIKKKKERKEEHKMYTMIIQVIIKMAEVIILRFVTLMKLSREIKVFSKPLTYKRETGLKTA